VRGDKPAIRWHAISGLQKDDVARHEVTGCNLGDATVTPNTCVRSKHLPQGGHGLARAVLLHKSQDRVEKDDGKDHSAVLEITDQSRQQGSPQEDDNEQPPELVEEQLPRGREFLLDEPIGTVGF